MVTDGRRASGIQAVLPVWCERQSDVYGRYRTRLTLTALMQLLRLQQPALTSLMVRAQRPRQRATDRCRERAVDSQHRRADSRA